MSLCRRCFAFSGVRWFFCPRAFNDDLSRHVSEPAGTWPVATVGRDVPCVHHIRPCLVLQGQLSGPGRLPLSPIPITMQQVYSRMGVYEMACR